MKELWNRIWKGPYSRWALVVTISVILHLGLLLGLRVYATQMPKKRVFKKLKFRLFKKRRPPVPRKRQPPPPRRKKPKKKPKKKKKKRKKKKKKPRRRIPPPNRRKPRKPPRRPPPPVFGVTKKSFRKGKGKGFNIRHGNTLMKNPDKGPLRKVLPYRPPPPTPPAPPPRRRVRSFAPVPIYEVDENPRELQKVNAAYPADAKERGIEAVVILSVQIRKSGRVRHARVISVRPDSSKSYGFGKAAVAALKKYRFRAARFKGKPVDVIVRYVYKFVLDD